MNTEASRFIPSPIKHEVRQRCGFGCVVCGMPLIEYHHMTPWEVVREHTVDNLTLLCPNHHKEATEPNASIAESRIREYDADPFNLKVGWSAARSLSYREPVTVRVGPAFEFLPHDGPFGVISIDGYVLLGFKREQDHLLLNFNLRDERNRHLVQIVDNEVSFNPALWDIEWVSNRLTIRRDRGDIVLRMQFQPDIVVIERVVLRLNGAELTTTPSGISTDGRMSIGVSAGGTAQQIGVNFGFPPPTVRPGVQIWQAPRNHGYCQRTPDVLADILEFLRMIGAPEHATVLEVTRNPYWARPVRLNAESATLDFATKLLAAEKLRSNPT